MSGGDEDLQPVLTRRLQLGEHRQPNGLYPLPHLTIPPTSVFILLLLPSLPDAFPSPSTKHIAHRAIPHHFFQIIVLLHKHTQWPSSSSVLLPLATAWPAVVNLILSQAPTAAAVSGWSALAFLLMPACASSLSPLVLSVRLLHPIPPIHSFHALLMPIMQIYAENIPKANAMGLKCSPPGISSQPLYC